MLWFQSCALLPTTPICGTLHSRREEVGRLLTSGQAGTLDDAAGPSVITGPLIRKEGRGAGFIHEGVQDSTGHWQLWWQRKGHEPQNSAPTEAKKAGNTLPGASGRNVALSHLAFSPVRPTLVVISITVRLLTLWYFKTSNRNNRGKIERKKKKIRETQCKQNGRTSGKIRLLQYYSTHKFSDAQKYIQVCFGKAIFFLK